jgi:CRISPR-associated protein Cmr6
VLHCDGQQIKGRVGHRFQSDTNALVLLRQVAFLDGDEVWKDARAALLRWARECGLGQDPVWVQHAARRREQAVAARVAAGGRRGEPIAHRRVEVSPEWRMVTGIGDRANPHEIGIALHGTYGWPVIPGSTIKGAARAWATTVHRAAAEEVTRVFGTGPGAGEQAAGSVDVLDALPVGGPVRVRVDGVTPHVQPYYGGHEAPTEWHNPVPSSFLVVGGGRFAVDLIGPADDVELAATWCRGACDDLGIGAKTGAGYGYLTVHDSGHGPGQGQGHGPGQGQGRGQGQEAGV